MADDIISKCISANPIANGGIVVSSPRGASSLGSDYTIGTYASILPSTGTVHGKYDTRFTGIAPCVNSCKTAEVIGNGIIFSFFT